MAHAEKCPICDGTGNTAKEPYPYIGTRQTCHGCGGKGWVEIADVPPTGYWPWMPHGIPSGVRYTDG